MASEVNEIDFLVIGAGVIGLAVARALALQGREVMVLEAEEHIGSITSARNSGVIHAGLYYKTGSLKARCCVEGRHLLYAFAVERGIAHRKCGKFVVATSEDQIPKLEIIKANAEANGVENMRLISGAEARQAEPELSCVAALDVPVTGVIDVHNYLFALQGDAEAHGAMIVCRAPVLRGVIEQNGFRLAVGGDAPMELRAQHVINAAGLDAQKVAASIEGVPSSTIPPLVLAKGSYFSLTGLPPFSRLIYPVPVEGSQGLHYSTDFTGRGRFGPDVEWIDRIDYSVDPQRIGQFAETVRRYYPKLDTSRLQPDYAGIRPKLGRLSAHNSDFMIQGPDTHGVQNLINLYGIESPGLTSSLALAKEAVKYFA